VTVLVCLFGMRLCVAKTTERIDVMFVAETLGGTRNIVLDWCLDPPYGMGKEREGKFYPLHNSTAFTTHSPDGVTFDADPAKVL